MGNNLTGQIPPELGNLQRLEEFWLSGNDLTGPIPPELGQLQILTSLELGWNNLSGPIPPEIGQLQYLRRLELTNNNKLAGPLPDTFTSLAALTDLYTSNTQLCAPTDAAFQAWLDGIEHKSGVVNCGE